MKEPHSREARLGDLGRADGVIGAGRLASALGIEVLVALPKVHEPRLFAVRRAEVEMAAVDTLEEAGGAEILVLAEPVDIGPERLRVVRQSGFSGKIFAALGNRRRKAEIEAEQG